MFCDCGDLPRGHCGDLRLRLLLASLIPHKLNPACPKPISFSQRQLSDGRLPGQHMLAAWWLFWLPMGSSLLSLPPRGSLMLQQTLLLSALWGSCCAWARPVGSRERNVISSAAPSPTRYGCREGRRSQLSCLFPAHTVRPRAPPEPASPCPVFVSPSQRQKRADFLHGLREADATGRHHAA